MPSIEERLRRVELRAEVLEFIYGYCRVADNLDWDGMSERFVEDCVVSYIEGEPEMRGRESLREMLSTYLPNTASSQHMITNTELIFNSETDVTVYTYMYSLQRYKGFPVTADCHRWGRYENRIIRTKDGWRFTHMRLLSAMEYGGSRIGEQFGRPFPPRFS